LPNLNDTVPPTDNYLGNTTAFSELTPIKELYQKWLFWTIWI